MKTNTKLTNSMLPTMISALTPSLASFFDDDFFNFPKVYGDKMTLPSVNVIEKSDKFEIEVSAPGYKKDNFDISIDNDRMTISSNVESSNEDKGENYTRREFSKSSFKRTFQLPESVDVDKISANYEDGILIVNLPKVVVEPEIKNSKKIEIK